MAKKEITEKRRVNFNVELELYSAFRKKLVELSEAEGRPIQQTDILSPLLRRWVDGKIKVKPEHSRGRG